MRTWRTVRRLTRSLVLVEAVDHGLRPVRLAVPFAASTREDIERAVNLVLDRRPKGVESGSV